MELTANQIQKYKTKSQPQLKALAVKWFNQFIRNRDREGDTFMCRACGQYFVIRNGNMHAAHYYSAGHNHALEFNELNVNACDVRCNKYLAGNLIPYGEWMLKTHGKEEMDKLEMVRNNHFKPDRIYYISIIEKYKPLVVNQRKYI